MKKIFLSLPMSGRSDEEIRAQIEEMKAEFLLKNPFDDGEEIKFVDNFDFNPHEGVLGLTSKFVKTEPLLYLGNAIQKMAYVDGVYFGSGWTNARGCQIEREVAYTYSIPCYIFHPFEQKVIDMDKHCWKAKLHSSGCYIDLKERVEKINGC